MEGGASRESGGGGARGEMTTGGGVPRQEKGGRREVSRRGRTQGADRYSRPWTHSCLPTIHEFVRRGEVFPQCEGEEGRYEQLEGRGGTGREVSIDMKAPEHGEQTRGGEERGRWGE